MKDIVDKIVEAGKEGITSKELDKLEEEEDD